MHGNFDFDLCCRRRSGVWINASRGGGRGGGHDGEQGERQRV